MNKISVYPIGSTAACHYASNFLKQSGLTLVDHPTPEVTHLLLDIPSFQSDGNLRGGGNLRSVLEMLPEDITVIGGNMAISALNGYKTIDLLKDAHYLAANAAITADCAIRVAAPLLDSTFSDSPTLILGWGRIGKCLGQLLRSMGTKVTFAVRKCTDHAIIQSLGYRAIYISEIRKSLSQHQLLFNTVPSPLLDSELLDKFPELIKIELASSPGIKGENVIQARGLPGIHAPKSSGRLIAETIIRVKEAYQ